MIYTVDVADLTDKDAVRKAVTDARMDDAIAASLLTGARKSHGIQSGEYRVMIGLARIADDQKMMAERKWQSGLKPTQPQIPCDVGLFSDDMNQVEMFMDPQTRPHTGWNNEPRTSVLPNVCP